MSIQFFSEDVDLPDVDYKLIRKILNFEIKTNNCKSGLINYIFCSNQYLLTLNVKFLNHDYFTDVITFDYSEENILSGDVYISTEMVQHNSVIFGQDLRIELIRVIAHGLLHLLKFNDKEEKDIIVMRRKENEIILKYDIS